MKNIRAGGTANANASASSSSSSSGANAANGNGSESPRSPVKSNNKDEAVLDEACAAV